MRTWTGGGLGKRVRIVGLGKREIVGLLERKSRVREIVEVGRRNSKQKEPSTNRYIERDSESFVMIINIVFKCL